jgi:hypothetical protein
MRAVIYARFSTELQSAASIEDQARLCRERATALGLTVVGVHSDCAISGATPVNRRPGASACMADALAGKFDVLLIESLDRCRAISSSRRRSFGGSSTGESASSESPTATTAIQVPGESCCEGCAGSSAKRISTTCAPRRIAG